MWHSGLKMLRLGAAGLFDFASIFPFAIVAYLLSKGERLLQLKFADKRFQ